MTLSNCPNGHFYDSSCFSVCPYCGQSDDPGNLFRGVELLRGCGAPQPIASGSTCDVYLVEKDGRLCALKVLDCGTDAEKLRNAKNEITCMEKVASCKNVVRLIDTEIRQQGECYTVFLLEEYMTAFEQFYKDNNLTIHDALRLGIQISEALEACWNAGVAHLDVQPKNLFVGPGGVFCLGDFGTALPVDMLAGSTQLRGTLSYMAPEVYHGRQYSQASDIYSLGMILYCLLHKGMLPLADKYPKDQAINKRLDGEPVVPSPACPEELSRCIRKACAFRPEDRYRTFQQLRQALTEVLICGNGAALSMPLCSKEEIQKAAPAPKATVQRRGVLEKVASLLKKKKPVPKPPAPMSATPVMPAPAGNLFDSDSLAMTCALEDLPPMPQQSAVAFCEPPAAPRMDQVQFSAVAPKEAVKGEYSLIQIFMYEQDFRHVVQEAIEMAQSPAQEKRSGIHKVREDTRVKIVLTSPDMEIFDNTEEQTWSGGYLQFDFAICPPEDYQKRQMLLTAAVYFDDIPATRLMLTIKPQASAEEQIEVTRKDIATAFVSYASQDRSRVGSLIQGMRKARPDLDIFFDVNSLRSGEDWEKVLYREIERRDLFFLCWSRFARESPWVDREWRFALERKGAEVIEPIPLEPPDVCPPPEELSSKHFNDSLLFIINHW